MPDELIKDSGKSKRASPKNTGTTLMLLSPISKPKSTPKISASWLRSLKGDTRVDIPQD